MVDFQSRDTRRTRSVDDEDTDESADTAESEEADSEHDADAVAEPTDDTAERDIETALGYAVVTVSNEKTIEGDEPGAAAVSAIEAADDAVVARELVQPSYDDVQSTVVRLVGRVDVDAIVTIGGTGVSPAGVTPEAIGTLFDKDLPGFGELFRRQEQAVIGTAVVDSRATAGIVDQVPVFAVPDETDATERTMDSIILSEADRIVREAVEDVSEGPMD